MKKIYLSLTLLLLASFSFSQTSTYNGNDSTGFDGSVGLGSLNISYDGTNLNFLFTKGGDATTNFNDVLVIYIDNGNGGLFTSTNFLTDVSTGLTQAITGAQAGSANKGILTFTSGFTPQYALAFGPNNSQGAVLDSLTVGTFSQITTPTLSNNGVTNATTYSLSITPEELGLTGPDFMFHFVASYISNTGYRSNESIGINFPAGTGNIAWGNFSDTTSALLFSSTNLPVSFGNLAGVLKNSSVYLSWNTKSESNLSSFTIQKSVDGSSWSNIGNVSPKNSLNGATYSFVDNSVSSSKNYYRLQILNKNNSFTYSPVITINKNGIHIVKLLGNPVSSVINLNISDNAAGQYQLSLYSTDGRLLSTQIYNHPGGSSTTSINVPSGAKGMCLLKVTTGTDSQTMQVVVE